MTSQDSCPSGESLMRAQILVVSCDPFDLWHGGTSGERRIPPASLIVVYYLVIFVYLIPSIWYILGVHMGIDLTLFGY